MIIVDVIAVLALVAALAIGVGRGFLATVGTLVGLVAGALAAYWLVPVAGVFLPGGAWRGILLASSAIFLVVLGAAIGTGIGTVVRKGVERTPLRGVDRVLGGVLNVVVTALVLLLVGTTVTATGTPLVASAVGSSRVLRMIDALTPTPVDAALAQLRGAVLADGLPTLGELLSPQAQPTAPPLALDDPELQQAAASVARISGTASACGVAMTGSGFVAADDLVVTNAHVLAGVEAPLVELPGGTAREGRVVYFDPVDDLAVIAVADLPAEPLPIVDTIGPGTPAVVQGYPHGGPLTSTGAHVLSVGAVPVPDIYGESAALREIYSLQADVQPGNSGGPLLTEDGEVAGVVFARGDVGQSLGYAVTPVELAPALAEASGDSPTVSTGACAA
ncbi:MarP family serine protease [Microbacterium sp.]|uniref:MarP family serine protease n=1 Tax=Microbacterium sp. TaxID=51671 RepID=UPI002D77BE24|nr:MarP family serine protease [Microbacterium sp.]HET6301926.1 MarP family serine protease [Microbacterium sp.]